MSAKLVAIVSAAVGLLFLSLPSFSHHGSNIVYDLNQTITISGTVTDFQFVNPHTLIFFDVTADDGTVVGWLGGLPSSIGLGRNEGWNRDTIKPGDEISITGAPARRDAPSVWVEQLIINGEPMLRQQYTG